MDLLGFLRRRPPAAGPATGPVYRAPAWRAAAPLQRTIAPPDLVTAPARFRSELVSWADPSLIGAPAHVVSAEAPSGTGHGLATPIPPAPTPPAAVQRVVAEPERGWRRRWGRDGDPGVQRAADGPAPAAPDAVPGDVYPGGDDPADASGAGRPPDAAAAPDGPRAVLPAVAAPPPAPDLVRADHAPLPPPVRMPAVPLQRAVPDPPPPAAGPGYAPALGVPAVRSAAGEVEGAASRPVPAPAVQRVAVPAPAPSTPRPGSPAESRAAAAPVGVQRVPLPSATREPAPGAVPVPAPGPVPRGPGDPPVAATAQRSVTGAPGPGPGAPPPGPAPEPPAVGAVPPAAAGEPPATADAPATRPTLGEAAAVQRFPSGVPGAAGPPVPSAPVGRPRRFGLGAPLQRSVDPSARTAIPTGRAEPVATPVRPAPDFAAPDFVTADVGAADGGAADAAAWDVVPPDVVGPDVVGPDLVASGPTGTAVPGPDRSEPEVFAPLVGSAPVAGSAAAPPVVPGVDPPAGGSPSGPTGHELPPVQRALDGPSAGDGRHPLLAAAAGPGPAASGVPAVQRRSAGAPAGHPVRAWSGRPPTGAPGPSAVAVDPSGAPPVRVASVQRAADGGWADGGWADGGWAPGRPDESPVVTGLVGARPLPDGSTSSVAARPDLAPPSTAAAAVQRWSAPASPGGGPRAVASPPASSAVVQRASPAAPGPPAVDRRAANPAVPASVQRLLAAQAAQQAAQQVVLQRDDALVPDAAAPPPESPPESPAAPPDGAVAEPVAGGASPAPVPPAGTAAGTGGQTDVDALVGRLYDPLVRRLRAELRLDRERAGHVLDLRL